MFKDTQEGQTHFDPEAEKKAREQQKGWEERFDEGWAVNNPEHPRIAKREAVKRFISNLLSEERKRIVEEEYRFILNVLDGIDTADEYMNDTMGIPKGGTKAIRFALQARYGKPLDDIEKLK